MIKKQNLKKITLYLNEQTWQKLDKLSVETDNSKAKLVRMAVNEYLKRKENDKIN